MHGSGPEVTTIHGNWGAVTGANDCIVKDFTIRGYVAVSAGGTSVFTNNIFIGEAYAVYCRYSSPTITNNIAMTKYSWTFYIHYASSPFIANNLIIGEPGSYSAGIGCWNAHYPPSGGTTAPVIINNTIANVDLGIYINDNLCSPTIVNNIVYRSRGWGIWDLGGSAAISYNNVWGSRWGDYGWCSPGPGGISTDPLFLDPVNGDFHLQETSPCLDAGDNSATGALDCDLDGKLRIWDGNCDGTGIVDMGAFEFGSIIPNSPPVGDANGPYAGYPNTPIVLDASASYDVEDDPLQFRWDLNGDGLWDTDWNDSPFLEYSWSYAYNGTITVEVSDGVLSDEASTSVMIMTAQEGAEIINDDIQELPEEVFSGNANQKKNVLENKIDALIALINEAEALIDAGLYEEARDKLQNDIRSKMDGSLDGNPRNDWITDPDVQAELCAQVDALIAYLNELIDGIARRLADDNVLKPQGLFLSVYPNPFNASIRIETPDDADVEIYNITGQRIDEVSGGITLWTPDNNFAVGVCLVRARLENETITRHVIYLK